MQNKTFPEQQVNKIERQIVYCVFCESEQRLLFASWGQEKLSVTTFTSCELIRVKVITFVILVFVSRHTSWMQLNTEFLVYACCDLIWFCDRKSGTCWYSEIRQISNMILVLSRLVAGREI